jgi:crossover junction endodeoxyribonuclease RuvC
MRALGIDPGSSMTGFGVVEQTASGYRHLDSGVVRTRPGQPLPERLATIYRGILRIIDETRPDEVAIEEVFVARNSRAALVLGQARGVVLLAAAQSGLVVAGYAPRQMKKALVGYGDADKTQVGEMVRRLLALPGLPYPADVGDALALALCHLHHAAAGRRLREAIAQ